MLYGIFVEDGIYDGDANYYNAQNFDATSNTDLVATANTDVSACRNHFLGLANSFSRSLTGVTVDSTSLSFSTTSESTPLTNGLQLGYNFVKLCLIAKMECGSCLGSRAYTRIQFSRTKTTSCIKPVREEVIQQ